MDIICKSEYYIFYQSESERCFYIDFGSKTIPLSLCQLLSLRHKINAIPIEHHFDSTLNKHGFEILQLCNKAHLFILTTLEILDLNYLLDQSFIALGLAVRKEPIAL